MLLFCFSTETRRVKRSHRTEQKGEKLIREIPKWFNEHGSENIADKTIQWSARTGVRATVIYFSAYTISHYTVFFINLSSRRKNENKMAEPNITPSVCREILPHIMCLREKKTLKAHCTPEVKFLLSTLGLQQFPIMTRELDSKPQKAK